MLDSPEPQKSERSSDEGFVKLSGDTVKGWEVMMQLFYPE
jgi:hypothetical protein